MHDEHPPVAVCAGGQDGQVEMRVDDVRYVMIRPGHTAGWGGQGCADDASPVSEATWRSGKTIRIERSPRRNPP